MALTDKLAAVADALREKTNTIERITLAEMPAMISSITGGGTKEYINFYDYDGTLLRQYPLSEFAQLNSLPLPPDSLTGCRCTGWNYDLATLKQMNCQVNVSAIYRQEDTESVTLPETEPVYVEGTKLYLHLDRELTVYLYYRQSKAQGVTVHWGDEQISTPSTSYGSSNISLQHNYLPGDYCITFDIVEGCTLSLGTSGTCTSVMGSVSFSGTWLPRLCTLVRAEVDLRNTIPTTGAFRYCTALEAVSFGNGNAYILPSYLFEQCYNLEQVQLCTSITGISDYAFRQCYRLRDLLLPTSLTSISSYAFAECRRLHSITIPGVTKTIGSYAFQSCTALKKVILEDGIQTIGTYAFGGCLNLQEINLPNSITSLNGQAFYQCYALQQIVLPAGITTLAASLFQACVGLRTVVIPEGVTSIGSSTFQGCTMLQYVGLPRSLTVLGSTAFGNCFGLKNLVFGADLKSIGATALQNCYSLEYIILPASTTTIGVNAFQNCSFLKNLILPENLKAAPGALTGCDMRNEAIGRLFEEMLTACSALPDYAFYCCKYLSDATLYSDIPSIGAYAFANDYLLQKVALPARLTSLGNYAFQNAYALKAIELPATLTSIGSNAFEVCGSLERVILPGALRTVGASAFASCYGIREFEFRANAMSISNAAFSNTYRLERLVIPTFITTLTLAQSAFSNSGLEAVESLPASTTFGEGSLFSNCYALEKANVENARYASLNSANSLFLNDYALATIRMPERTSIVGTSMFQTCYALKDIIEIGESVDTINSNAFYDCRTLKGIKFSGNELTTVGSNAFYNCYSLRKIEMPHNVSKMQTCFVNCFNLASIYMYPLEPPTGVTSIGNFADDYKIFVPKGHLAAYESQWSSHKGHYQEFEFMIADRKKLTKTIALHDTEVVIKNAFIHTAFEDEQTFTITPTYSGSNLKDIKDASFDFENSLITFQFDRAEVVDYTTIETMGFHVQVDGTDISCDFSVQLRYVDSELVSEYEVTDVSGYAFLLNSNDYYESSNKGIHNSYALCKVNFVTATGKLYVDCIGEGEANYDYGLLSNLDQVLSSSITADTGAVLKKSFYGAGKYNQTVEYEVEDFDEHFIYIKYRKDGSVNTGADNMQFQIRFEDI